MVESFRGALDVPVEQLELGAQRLGPRQERGPALGSDETDALVERSSRELVVAAKEVRTAEK